MPLSERLFWRNATCTVRVSYNDSGSLVFYGEALAADGAVDVVDLVCAHVDEIMVQGERSWLDDHGIEREFSSY